jgi:hypothetical protein
VTAEAGREIKQRQALLGRLASLGWFARRGEVAATQALAVLLEEPQLREGLVGHLGQAVGTKLDAVVSFQPELIHADGARPDLEGQDSHGRPLVVVEAKFGAILSREQVKAYLTDQEARLAGGARGALVLLVPSYRKPEAESLLDALGDRADSLAAVSTGVATWDEWLDVLDVSAQDLDPPERDAVRCDVRQLRALCATMRGVDVPPLEEVAEGVGMDEREKDLRRLADEVTRRFRFPTGQLIPIGFEAEFGYYRRYMPGGPDDADCCASVGVLSGLAVDTPFWLRYHKDTSSFQKVADRIMASPLAAQIEAIQAVAAGPETQ